METRTTFLVIGAVALTLLTACAHTVPHAQEKTSAVAPAATFVNGGTCEPTSEPGLPPNAGCVTSVTAARESVTVYALVDHGRPSSWRIKLETPDGNEDQRLYGGTVTSYPRAVAVVDVDRDGDPDWWVKARDYTSHGAPWAGLYLFVQNGDSISPAEYQGKSLVIDFGGISRRGNGAICRDGDLLLLQADARDPHNRRWDTVQRRFALNGDRATLVDTVRGVLHISGYNDPDLDPYYEVQCYGTNFSVFGASPGG
ncbi:MAG: hypothetical protein ABR579_10750 [Actinomycetota bacterium]